MEIGGYFGLESFPNNEYYPNLVALNTGRNALAYLIRARKIEKLYIPGFLCDSVYRVCEREGCRFEFYEIDSRFRPVFDKELGEGEWLYIVNYYGQITDAAEYKNRYKRVILDNVQAFFSRPEEDIDTIYSCRKYFGVPDGAYLATDVRIELSEDSSRERMTHILGRFEDSASNYYESFNDGEEALYDLDIKLMSKLTHNLLGAIDYESVKSAREKNFRYLHSRLSDRNPLEIRIPEGPYMYPFYYEDGVRVRKILAGEKIYIPTLWPTAFGNGAMARDLSENILPLPCDQRYTENEMKTVLDALFSVM